MAAMSKCEAGLGSRRRSVGRGATYTIAFNSQCTALLLCTHECAENHNTLYGVEPESRGVFVLEDNNRWLRDDTMSKHPHS